MSPLTAATTELNLVVQRADAAAARLLMQAAEGHAFAHGAMEDHRTSVLGELLEAIDRIDPTRGLGQRLLMALYPFTCDECPDALDARFRAGAAG